MKAQVGSDAETGLVHTVEGTAANVADVTVAHALLHGDEDVVFADAGYQGVAKRPFGFTKVRYRGLTKNPAQLRTLFALANLWMARRALMNTG